MKKNWTNMWWAINTLKKTNKKNNIYMLDRLLKYKTNNFSMFSVQRINFKNLKKKQLNFNNNNFFITIITLEVILLLLILFV